VDKINNPATDRLPDDVIRNAPRRGIRRDYRSFQPTIMTPKLIAAIQRSDGVGYINYTIFVSDNNFKDIAREYFKRGGEFYEFMNRNLQQIGPAPSTVIINRLLSIFLLVKNEDEFNNSYTMINKRFRDGPSYFTGLVQAINKVSRLVNNGTNLIKYNVTKFKDIPTDQKIQKDLLIELFIKLGSSFHEYISTQSNLKDGLILFDQTMPLANNNLALVDGQYILKPKILYPLFKLFGFIETLRGGDIDNLELLKDPELPVPEMPEIPEGGRADGVREIQIDQD
jgi:hypothetical protein